MQKTKFRTFCLSTFVMLLLASCINYENQETVKTVKTSENITHESRHFDENFNQINVSSGINVILEQSNDTEVTVITDEDFQQKIKTKVENGTLYISNTTSQSSFSIFGYKRTTIHESATKKVIVKLPIIIGLEADAASKIENKGTLKGNTISLQSSSAAEIELKLEYEKINAECSSASKIDLEGMTLDFQANASSAGHIEAEDLLANTITAESSSASKISIHPILNLKANASSGGKIVFDTIPKQIEKETSSGGVISQD